MSDRGRGAVAVLVTALAAVALAAPAQGAYPGRNGLLAVVSSAPQSGGGAQRIDLIRLDGTRVRRIPCPRPCGDLWPVWSPDGRRLAFNARVDVAPGGLRIGVVRATGAGRRILPSPEAEVDAVAPAWSPDAMRLAFGAVGFSAGGIWTSDLRGLDVRRLSAGGDRRPGRPAGGSPARPAGRPRSGREIPFAPEPAGGRRLRLGLTDWQPVR